MQNLQMKRNKVKRHHLFADCCLTVNCASLVVLRRPPKACAGNRLSLSMHSSVRACAQVSQSVKSDQDKYEGIFVEPLRQTPCAKTPSCVQEVQAEKIFFIANCFYSNRFTETGSRSKGGPQED